MYSQKIFFASTFQLGLFVCCWLNDTHMHCCCFSLQFFIFFLSFFFPLIFSVCYFLNDKKFESLQRRVEGMVTNQLCTIVVGISSQIGRDGHRDMGDVSTYGKFIRNLLGSMKPPGSNLCADTQKETCIE